MCYSNRTETSSSKLSTYSCSNLDKHCKAC